MITGSVIDGIIKKTEEKIRKEGKKKAPVQPLIPQPTPHSTLRLAAGAETLRDKAYKRIMTLTREGGPLHSSPFANGKPMKDFVDLDDDSDRLCSCRNSKHGPGYDDQPWVYCDNDDDGTCAGFRCYHLNCIEKKLRPKDLKHDNFLCAFCVERDKQPKSRDSKPKRKAATAGPKAGTSRRPKGGLK